MVQPVFYPGTTNTTQVIHGQLLTAMMSLGNSNFSVMKNNSPIIDGHFVMSWMAGVYLNLWNISMQVFLPMCAFLYVVTKILMFLSLMDLKTFDILYFWRAEREKEREWVMSSFHDRTRKLCTPSHTQHAYKEWQGIEKSLTRDPPVYRSLTLGGERKCTNPSCFRPRSPIFFFYKWRSLRPRSHQFNRHIYCFPLLL